MAQKMLYLVDLIHPDGYHEISAHRDPVSPLSCLAALAAHHADRYCVRDFNADGVNFTATAALYAGAISALPERFIADPDGTGSSQISNSGPGAFSNWYTKTTDSMSYSLTLNETSPGSGIISVQQQQLLPIDGAYCRQPEPLAQLPHANITHVIQLCPRRRPDLHVHGDDDVWVFFDHKLGIDLGGHAAQKSQTVNLDTLMAGKTSGDYSFDFFFAERHTTQS